MLLRHLIFQKRQVIEALQYKARFGLDPKIHSPRWYANIQVFAKSPKKSGTSDSSTVIGILKEVEM